MASTDPPAPSSSASYSTDPALYIYTSLTAGSSHIVTATSRLETILRANRVPFKAIDLATDEKARMLWGRRAGKDESGRPRKMPGLVQMGMVLGVSLASSHDPYNAPGPLFCWEDGVWGAGGRLSAPNYRIDPRDPGTAGSGTLLDYRDLA